MKQVIFLLLSITFICVSPARADLSGAFTITYGDCELLTATLNKAGEVERGKSEGRQTQCIKKGGEVICDYLHEKTGKPVNQPSHYNVEVEGGGYILMSDENKGSRIIMSSVTKGVIMMTNVFLESNPDMFGLKFCSGQYKQ